MRSFPHHFMLLYIFSYCLFCQGTITQSPTTACVGDAITVSCVLTPPAGESFSSTLSRFLIGDDPGTLSPNDVSSNISHGNVDLSRFTAMTNSGTLLMVSATITLSYLNSDGGLRLGCTVEYVDSGTSMQMRVMETLQLVQAAPPSALSIQSISSSNIDPNTCSATVSLNWTAPSSTDKTVDLYYLSLQNGTALDSISAPANSYSHNTTLLLDTVYAYSVSASSCAGNSTAATSHLNPINSYSLLLSSLTSLYDNVSNMFTINWGLSPESAPLLIQYSLRYNYSHSQGNATIMSNANMMSTFFILSSGALTYIQSIPAANFVGTEEIETNITACLSITQQCGQSYSGIEISNSSRTITSPPDIPPTPPPVIPTSSTIPSSSIPSSSNSISIPISPTPLVTTNNPTTNPTSTTAAGISPAIIGGAIGGIILVLLILVLLLILLGVCIYFVKKRDQEPKESDRFNMRGFEGNQSKESVDGQPDATYSQVNKPPKAEQPLYADIKKPQKELLYADLEHVAPASGMVKPPTVPSTHYADLAQFSHSEQTTYATVQDTKY